MHGFIVSFIFRRKVCNDRDENSHGEIAAEIHTDTGEKFEN